MEHLYKICIIWHRYLDKNLWNKNILSFGKKERILPSKINSSKRNSLIASWAQTNFIASSNACESMFEWNRLQNFQKWLISHVSFYLNVVQNILSIRSMCYVSSSSNSYVAHKQFYQLNMRWNRAKCQLYILKAAQIDTIFIKCSIIHKTNRN